MKQLRPSVPLFKAGVEALAQALEEHRSRTPTHRMRGRRVAEARLPHHQALAGVRGSRTHPGTGSRPGNGFEDREDHRTPSTPLRCAPRR